MTLYRFALQHGKKAHAKAQRRTVIDVACPAFFVSLRLGVSFLIVRITRRIVRFGKLECLGKLAFYLSGHQLWCVRCCGGKIQSLAEVGQEWNLACTRLRTFGRTTRCARTRFGDGTCWAADWFGSASFRAASPPTERRPVVLRRSVESLSM